MLRTQDAGSTKTNAASVTILRSLRAFCEQGAAAGGEPGPGFETLLAMVDWDAAHSDEPEAAAEAGDLPLPTVSRYLKAACEASAPANTPAGQLAKSLAARGEELRWKSMYAEYEDEPDMATFRRAYAYSLLVGPEAPLRSERVKAGVTLQGPDVLYPAHAHKAKELYAVIGGTGDWRRGVEPWTARPPGDFVLHPSGVRHSMQTGSEPVLALVAWISDVHSSVVIVRG